MVFQMAIMRLCLPVSTVESLSRLGRDGKRHNNRAINEQTATTTTTTTGMRVNEGRQPSSTKETHLDNNQTMTMVDDE